MRVHYPGDARSRDPFEDAVLYDWEYRRRRDDVRFYSTLADERGGPILDLGCGTGRLMLPLLRAGHVVVGVDRAPAMLARAAARLRRLAPRVRRRALLAARRSAAAARRPPLPVRDRGVPHHPAPRDRSRADALLRGRRARARARAAGSRSTPSRPTPSSSRRANAPGDPRPAGRAGAVFKHPTTGRRDRVLGELPARRTACSRRRSTTALLAHANGARAQRARRARAPPARARRGRAPARAATGLALIATWGGFDWRPLDAAHRATRVPSASWDDAPRQAENRLEDVQKNHYA